MEINVEKLRKIYTEIVTANSIKKFFLSNNERARKLILDSAVEFVFFERTNAFDIRKKTIYFDGKKLFEMDGELNVVNFGFNKQGKIISERDFIALFLKFVDKLINSLVSLYSNGTFFENINYTSFNYQDNVYLLKKRDKYYETRHEKEVYESIVKQEKKYYTISGESASGKTTLTMGVLEKLRKYHNYKHYFYDFSDVNLSAASLLFAINEECVKYKNHLFVFDNIQSHPSLLPVFLHIVSIIEKIYTKSCIQVLLISWNSASEFVYECCNNEQVSFYLSGDESIKEFISAANLQKFEKVILDNSSGDTLVAETIINYILDNGSCPLQNCISEIIYKDFTKGNVLTFSEKKMLYIMCSFSEFEIHVKESFLREIDNDSVDALNSKKIYKYYFRDKEKYVLIGHKSLANKILMFLKNDIDCSHSDLKQPSYYAVEYLKLSGSSQILATLERLDIQLRSKENVYSNLWKAFISMRQHLWSQMEKDPSWGNNMASMIFSAELFENIGFDNSSKNYLQICLSEIRKRWTYNEKLDGLKLLEDNITSEFVDFDCIKLKMQDEEKKITYDEEMSYSNIDSLKFHNNWLLGLLLGVESFANDELGSNNKTKYIECAKNSQQLDGSFYPKRVCWVTARMIIGLSKCGLYYQNSENLVKKACDWLISVLTEPKEMNWKIKNFNCCGWKSGTGEWNSSENVTLMCLSALFQAHYPIDKDNKLRVIIDTFWNYKHEISQLFVDRDNVLDINWMLDVMIYDHRDITSLLPELNRINDYLLAKWNTVALTSKETNTESSDVSFMAKELVGITWTVLSENLVKLLDDLELTYVSQDGKRDIFISYRRAEGGGSGYAHHLYERLDKRFPGEVFLDVKVLKTQTGEFNKIIKRAIDDCSVFIPILSRNFYERVLSENYNIDDDLFYQELKYCYSNRKNKIIIPLIFKNCVLIPPDLKSKCLEFYKIVDFISKQESVIYDSDASDAPQKMADEFIIKINNQLSRK